MEPAGAVPLSSGKLSLEGLPGTEAVIVGAAGGARVLDVGEGRRAGGGVAGGVGGGGRELGGGVVVDAAGEAG